MTVVKNVIDSLVVTSRVIASRASSNAHGLDCACARVPAAVRDFSNEQLPVTSCFESIRTSEVQVPKGRVDHGSMSARMGQS